MPTSCANFFQLPKCHHQEMEVFLRFLISSQVHIMLKLSPKDRLTSAVHRCRLLLSYQSRFRAAKLASYHLPKTAECSMGGWWLLHSRKICFCPTWHLKLSAQQRNIPSQPKLIASSLMKFLYGYSLDVKRCLKETILKEWKWSSKIFVKFFSFIILHQTLYNSTLISAMI